jgi:hypothetical protein
MSDSGRPPHWLAETVDSVMADLHGAAPIPGVAAAVALVDGLNGVSLVVLEPDQIERPLPSLPGAEALEPDAEPAGSPGGGNFVSRNTSGPALRARVAEILQEDLAETEVAWAQARPPCPHHPHPARPFDRDGEAWWVCERLNEPLYRIGRGEVPTRPSPAPTWSPQTRRSRKRKHTI